MKPRRCTLAFFTILATLLTGAAQAAAPGTCDKPLRGAWRVVADITPAGDIVGISDLMEKRLLKADGFFSTRLARFDGSVCSIRGITRHTLSKEQRDLYRDPVRDKYPVEIDFQCAPGEGVAGFFIGERCDELVTDWEGTYFLLKPTDTIEKTRPSK